MELKNHLNGKILMLPMPIGAHSWQEMCTPYLINTLKNTKYWVAENARTTRRFLSSLHMEIDIQNLVIFELNRDSNSTELSAFLSTHVKTNNIGVSSEAGLPGVADPGGKVASWGHQNGIEIVSFIGPGSIFLALSGSGLNGQQFTFHGYPPIKENDLKPFVLDLCKNVKNTGYTHIFIETPYRSDRMLKMLLDYGPSDIHLCLAVALHEENSLLKTQTLAGWKNNIPTLGKAPSVYLLGMPVH
ncbi:MAG: SAM-dependent methyltransferase [Bacteroidia bacterium]|nr:SAM-dependent methyltransferase [Bacteroidia bacterium]